MAATADEKIRAFERHSGRVLWEFQLPAGGYATPSVYLKDGKQYVAIAAGGSGKNGTKAGDSIIAFALPEQTGQQALTGGEWIQLFDGKTLDGLGAHERCSQLHSRKRGHCRPDRGEQCEDELLPVLATGVRRLRA